VTLVKQLSGFERPKLKSHFLALPPEDVYLRFGLAQNSAAIIDYVEHLDFERDAVFGVYGDNLELIGVAHLAPRGEAAELGISVLRGQRGRGVGTAIFSRAIEHARNLNLDSIFVHFLAENLVIRRLVRKLGLISVMRGADSEASMALLPGNAGTVWSEWLDDRIALYDYRLKSQVQLLKRQRLNRKLKLPEPTALSS
jgi:RimJ/RimL family protein N-acetyltransferase